MDVAILSSAAMDGNNGGWPILFGETPIDNNEINLAIDEDQIKDSERKHNTEQVAYLVIDDLNMAKTNNTVEATEAILQDQFMVQLFPIPTQDVLNIRSTSEIAQVTIYNLSGQQMNTYREGQLTTIDVSHLHSGAYFILASSPDGKITKRKFIKQ
jgi:hypothetical protein